MRTFKTKDDVLTLLIHLGYLGYHAELKEAFILKPLAQFFDFLFRKASIFFKNILINHRIFPVGRGL